MNKLTTLQIVILILVIMSLFITFSTAFAHWQSVTTVGTVDVILVHDEIEITITDLSPDGEDVVLVPEGEKHFPKDVEVIERLYAVEVIPEDLINAALHIEAFDITIGGDTLYAHLVQIDIDNQGPEALMALGEEKTLVLVSISLQEPIDEEEAQERGLPEEEVNVADAKEAYRAIKNQDIVFSLRFTLRRDTVNNEN